MNVTIVRIESAGPRLKARRLIFSDLAVEPILTAGSVVRALDLSEGDEVDTEDLAASLAETAHECARTRALHLLGYRERSYRELVSRLIDDGYGAALADAVARRMQELGYVDDERFARLWVANRVAAGIGPVRVRRELRGKGVPDEIADAALGEALCDSDSVDAARRVLGSAPLATRSDRDRAFRKLVRRGFSLSCARQAVAAEQQDDAPCE